MQDSDFENSTEGTNENGSSTFSADPSASRIVLALNQGDHETADVLLRDALAVAPDNKQLLRLAAKQRRLAERFGRVYSLLKETREAIEGNEFVRAVGAFREAANLSQGFADLEQASFQVGVEQASHLGERNWRIARVLLEDAASLNPRLTVPEEGWRETEAAEREETIANVLGETALPKPAELGRARERLLRTLKLYPEDPGLLNRLKSIESSIEDKRKWDERQKCLKKLTELRDALQRETDLREAGKYVPQSEALTGPYGSEPEFSSIVEDIRHQVISSERAAAALRQDRIEDCLEECAWVLSRMRHHQLFLKLKQEAEDRELSLVDEYSDSVSRIKDLLAAGKLIEADDLCAKARVKLPQFTDLKELAREIAARKSEEDVHQREKAEGVRRLVERGDRSLHENQYKLAEQSFANAIKLQPDNERLKDFLVQLLHDYARSIVRDNPQSADEVLQLTARLFPGFATPADLIEALQKRREQAKQEAIRWSALARISTLDAQLEAAKKREDAFAVRAEAEKNNFAFDSHRDVKEAATALFSKIETKAAEFDRKQARRPAIYAAMSIAATVFLGIGLVYWLSNRSVPHMQPVQPKTVESATIAKPPPTTAPHAETGSLVIRSEVPGVQVMIGGKRYTTSNDPLKVELNADSYQISGSRAGFQDFGPVTVAVNKAEETVLDVKLIPKPASLEIRNAEPNTEIKLDGVLLAKATANERITKELPAGKHSIELSRAGFLRKTLTRDVGPGEVVVLGGRDVQLESSDTRALAEEQTWAEVGRSQTSVAMENYLRQYPSGTHASAARAKIQELQWQAVDKTDPEALRAFAGRYPDGPLAAEAKQQVEAVLVARESKAEDNDWSAIDHGSPAALEGFLKRHPGGQHAAAASTTLTDVERKARIGETQRTEEAAWRRVNRRDEASLESFIRESPRSPHRNEAEVELGAIRLRHASANETAAVLTVISRFADAWKAKDLDSILAIQKNLSKRAVRAELSHVMKLDMQISPASPPQIDGEQAVVLCRRQASQIYSDGTRKLIPESIVSYVLAKHDGNWTIEGTR